MVYVVLTGKPPFEGKSFTDLVRQISSAPPVPPRRVQPKIAPPLEEVVMRLLAKRPGDRYGSAAELLDVLEGIARFQGVNP
jgi:serine/threonine-protein kinase